MPESVSEKKPGSKNQIKIGMILSYLNIGIGNIIPLIYTPIMLSLLGQNEYGLYKLASSTSSYLSLLALGIGSAITRYLIKARTEGGKENEERFFGLFYIIFQVIAVVSLVVGLILAFNIQLFYSRSLTADQLDRMRILLILMSVSMAISFSATSYNAVTSAHEQFIFIHSINILSTIGIPVVNLIILHMGYRSIGMAVTSLCINILIRISYILFVRFRLELSPRFSHVPFHILKEILVFSFWIFLSNIVSQIYGQTDTVIIGMIPGLATVGVAVYHVGATFPHILFSLAQVAPGLFMPKANRMVFSGCSNTELTDLVIRVGRMQCFIVALITSGFIAFGRGFINWYVGSGYEEAYWVAVIIMIPDCIPLVQSAAHSIIQAQNRHRFRALVYLLIAGINVVFTILLVRKFGIIGAAIPTGAAYLFGNGLLMNWYYWKKIGLEIPRFWMSVLPIFSLAAVLCALTLALSKVIDLYKDSNLFAGILIYTIIYLAILWVFIMTPGEKASVTGLLKRR